MKITLIIVFKTARDNANLTLRIASPAIITRQQLDTAAAAIIAAAPGVAANSAEPSALISAKYVTVNSL